MSLVVTRASASDIADATPALARILVACVSEGAGLGFTPPLSLDEAARYWEGAARDVAAGSRVVVLAQADAEVVGTAALDLCQRSNGLHRAECQKVMVAPQARRAGVGEAMMRALDAEARREWRTTLYLDTFAHQSARKLYERCGWTRAGDIPRFASDGTGIHATSLYYKLLEGV